MLPSLSIKLIELNKKSFVWYKLTTMLVYMPHDVQNILFCYCTGIWIDKKSDRRWINISTSAGQNATIASKSYHKEYLYNNPVKRYTINRANNTEQDESGDEREGRRQMSCVWNSTREPRGHWHWFEVDGVLF